MSVLDGTDPAGVVTLCVPLVQERDGFGGAARGRGRGRGAWNVGAPGGIQEVTYTIPADKCGLVIGKGTGSFGFFLIDFCTSFLSLSFAYTYLHTHTRFSRPT